MRIASSLMYLSLKRLKVSNWQDKYFKDIVFVFQFPLVASYLLPVMVYIEAGGFQNGGAERSGPKSFMDEEVVLVTFNYR
jgi:hypothetical protein